MSVRQNQDRWIAALKSDEYEKGFGALHSKSDCFCAMGVALKALGFSPEPEPDPFTGDFRYRGHLGTAPAALVKALALRSSTGSLLDNPEGYSSITAMNDQSKLTLPQIGEWIEANREKVFTTCS